MYRETTTHLTISASMGRPDCDLKEAAAEGNWYFSHIENMVMVSFSTSTASRLARGVISLYVISSLGIALWLAQAQEPREHPPRSCQEKYAKSRGKAITQGEHPRRTSTPDKRTDAASLVDLPPFTDGIPWPPDEDNTLSKYRIVTTRHEISVDDRTLNYFARAGRLPILENETGEVLGRLFFTSYSLSSTPNRRTRPLMFLWNGGPGASSSLVHLLGFGPRRIQPDGAIVDNQGTWLDHTDLVFVDPIGTGYSRPAKAEYGPMFYQTQGDAESIAEFIRVYRNRFAAWDAPIFLAGESFGVTRAAAVAAVLEQRGIAVHGVILMGGNLPLGRLTAEQRIALTLPSYTAAAFANKKLAPDLQRDLRATLRQAENWARTEYVSLLGRRDSLNDADRHAAVIEVARLIGLDPRRIDRKTLTVTLEEFSRHLLADRKQVVGHYDSRLVGPYDPAARLYDPTQDPSLRNIIDQVGVVRYFRNQLQYTSDLQYQGPFGGSYPPPRTFRGDWMSVKWDFGPADRGSQQQPLDRAMKANPKLQVLIASGYYDLASSYYANDYLASHLEPKVARNVIARTYRGGHAIYTDKVAQMDLKRDVAQFIQKTLGLPR